MDERKLHTIEAWMLQDEFFNIGARLKLFILIRTYTINGKYGNYIGSMSEIENKTSIPRRTLVRLLQELEENGYITIERIDGKKNRYKSIENPNPTSAKVAQVTSAKMALAKEKGLVPKSAPTSAKNVETSAKVAQDQCQNGTSIRILTYFNNILTNSNKAVNICYLDNTHSKSDLNSVNENDKKEESETAEKDTAITATAIRHDGNNGCPTPSDNNPSLSLTDYGKTDTTEGTATETADDKANDIRKLDRLLATRPLEEIVTDRLLEIYPQGKVDLNRDEILFRLKNIAHLEEETIYLLTLVKETMDINPYYVPKLSRYLDQGSYLQHFRVRMPLNEFSADFLVKKEWEAKMTKDDWKEAGELLLRDFDMGGNGFKDPLTEPSEKEKKEALAWLESLGQKKTGGAKQ